MPKRQYIRSSRARWAKANRIGPCPPGERTADWIPEEFILEQDDPQLEILIKFHDFSKMSEQRPLSAQVTMFDESWQGFTLWRDLWDALAKEAEDGGGMAKSFKCSPDRVEEILLNLGFEDETP